ncbi:double-strand break repair protein AddB [Caulobacter sp. KR2-114]|uniref:double-strand break repair protein AddB n=1 Tax=Caulobacter sp. KR2-114 TaxID=3400912 RepID=UPI003C0A446C
MSGFLDAPSPRWFTISAHRPFLEDLAAGVHAALSPLGPEALAEAVVLVPTRRAARGLAEAFLKAAGTRAVLLPQVRAIGDLDEGEPPFEPGDLALDLPAAISPWRRRFELARLVAENRHLLQRDDLDAGGALELADALAVFLDGLQIEEVADPGAVGDLVQGDLALHWRRSAQFLGLALEAWPRRLAELGLVDVAARRVALLRRLAERWSERPPAEVLVAAGSTGTAPAAADLLAAVSRAPRGAVVLPGLDKSLAETAWVQVENQHPQGSMRRLLDRAGIDRAAVRDWDPAAETEARGRWRRRLINEALRPADATADWLKQIEALRREGEAAGVDPMAVGLEGLSVITARSEDEAAAAAALLMRETLETPGATCALITHDVDLARRVSARLTRWGIGADTSAGQPLAQYPVAVLASLAARVAADPGDPVSLLALVKHPLVRLGLDEATLQRRRRALERYGLRGPRPGGWEALRRRLETAGEAREDEDAERVAARRESLDDALALLPALQAPLQAVEAVFAEGPAPAALAARAVAEALERLAAGPAGGAGELWAGLGGEAAAGLLSAVIAESEGLPPVSAVAFAELLDSLMSRETVRPGGATHPRLKILGVLEARLIRADHLILAGLEEGVWPPAAPIDPFLSRPMRKTLGLPPPERRIGLSAHDFAQAASAPRVSLIHAERRGGAPAVASRWLWRLDTLTRGAKVALPRRPEVLAWARALDAPARFRPAARPRPTPPLAVRPRRMPVTGVERWIRDPYAVYAREILQLRPLDPPDAPVEALARGTAIHAAFERFSREHPDILPPEAETLFAELLGEALRAAGVPEGRMARELALAANAAPWVVAFERRRRPGARLVIEQSGQLELDAPGGRFTLTAKADRIEARGAVADILDYKTGAAPSARQVRAGLSPQLTLTAAIIAAGGFADLGPVEPRQLVYVRVSGGRTPGREEVRAEGGEARALADAALAGLRKRIDWFDQPETGYLSWAMPQFIGRYAGDYDHLARLWEWHVIGEPDVVDGVPEGAE